MIAKGNEWPLLEASGAIPGGGGDALTLGKFCSFRGEEEGAQAAVINATAGELWLLSGPTPHIQLHLDGLPFSPSSLSSSSSSSDDDDDAHVSAASIASFVTAETPGGEEDQLVVAVGSRFVVIAFEPDCSGGEVVGAVVSDYPVLAMAPLASSLLVTFAADDGSFFGFVSYDSTSSSLMTHNYTDLSIPPRSGWSEFRGLATSSSAATVMAVRTRDSDPSQIDIRLFAFDEGDVLMPSGAAADVNLTASFLEAVIADVYGDGAPMALAVAEDSTVAVLWLPTEDQDGLVPPLYLASMFALESEQAGDVVWSGLAAGAFLSRENNTAVLPNEVQLFALRSSEMTRATDDFSVSTLLYGRPAHWTRRKASFAGLRSVQEFKTTFNDSGTNVANLSYPVDVEKVKDILVSQSVNAYAWTVCDCDVESPEGWGCSPLYAYEGFVRFLSATTDWSAAGTGGEAFRVWMGLLPPSEADPRPSNPSGCRIPTDSPLTPDFNETALWDGSALGYADYEVWGILLGRLAQQFPQLKGVDVDDFSANVGQGKIFTGDSVARFTSNFRRLAPWLVLTSVCYCDFSSFPDLALMLDAPVFFFRNAVKGAGPCEPEGCPWGPNAKEHTGSCLAGVCSEPTTLNAAAEIAAVVAGMPAGRPVIAGFYATGHSTSGQPTSHYVSRLMQTLAVQAQVEGIVVYTLKDAREGCDAGQAPLYGPDGLDELTLQHQLGCIVAEQFGYMLA